MALTTITDRIWDAELDQQAGTITITPSAFWTVTASRARIAPDPIIVTLDNLTAFTVDLVATDTLDGTGNHYNVTITIGAVTWDSEWIVPTSVPALKIKDVEV